MPATIRITVNSQELIEKAVAINDQLNTALGQSLTVEQRAKVWLLERLKASIYAATEATIIADKAAEAEALKQQEADRLAALD